jgi:GntR family transcriptional repressor for pyruvate dehydrogenase complex
VERRTVSSEVRDRLLDAVKSGQLTPGEAVPSERELCTQFGVARTSVREAIQGLLIAGVLERRGNRTVVVERLPDVQLRDDGRKALVRELFEVRRVIEPEMAALSARRASADERRRIAELASRRPRLLDEFRLLDREFHSAIAQSCHNPTLTEVYAKALAALFGSGEFASLLYAEINRREVAAIITSAVDAHQSIAAALVAGNVRATAAAVQAHLADVERRMLERLV